VLACFIDFTVDDPEEFARLRILHREGGQLVDRTVLPPGFPGPNFAGRQICASVDVPTDFYITIGPIYNVGGQVVTPSGLGLRNAIVTITDYRGVRQTATTSSFGVYSFPGIRGGETYTISVFSKRYRYAAKVVQIQGNIADIIFVGLE